MLKYQASGAIVAGVLTLLASVILTITASIYTAQLDSFKDLWKEIANLSIYSIVIGALGIVFAAGFLLGIFRKFTAWTILFSVLLIIVVLLAGVCSILLLSGRSQIRDQSLNNTRILFNNYSDSVGIVSSKPFFDTLQQSFECCGVVEATDWRSKLPNNTVVDSCCRKVETNCGKNGLIDEGKIYLRGCAEPIYAYIRRRYTTLFWMNTVLLVLAIITTVTGFMFERSIQEGYQTM